MSNYLIMAIAFFAGTIAKRIKSFPDNTPKVLNAFIIYVSLPALILRYLHQIKFDVLLLLPIIMPWIIFMAGMLFFYSTGKLFSLSKKQIGSLILTCALGNTSFLGLPMIESLLGKQGLPIAIIIDQTGTFLVLSTLGITLANIAGSKSNLGLKDIVKKIFTFPPFLFLICAILLNSVKFTEAITNALSILGSTLTPLALFLVGYQLRLNHVKKYKFLTGYGLLYKLIIAPTIIFGIITVLKVRDTLIGNVTLLEAAMAPMITGTVVAVEYDLEPEMAVTILALGIVLSFVTVYIWNLLL